MSDSTTLLYFAILIISIIIIIIINSICNKIKHCNSNYNRADSYDKIEIDEPEYTVHTIKRVSTKNKGMDIAEYTLWNFYINKKDSVEHQELIIYDEIGKYQIGDKLKFTKI